MQILVNFRAKRKLYFLHPPPVKTKKRSLASGNQQIYNYSISNSQKILHHLSAIVQQLFIFILYREILCLVHYYIF